MLPSDPLAANSQDISSPQWQKIFQALPMLCTILTPQLRIVAVTDLHLAATHRVRGDVIDRYIIDVYPDNPETPVADGSRNLHASLQRVLATHAPDTLPVQKYDIPTLDGTGFEEHYWTIRNTPALDTSGALQFIVNSVENVTQQVQVGIALQGSQAALQAVRSDNWRFMREMLFSVTDGKLRLCEFPSDLPARLTERGQPVPLGKSGANLAGLRQITQRAAESDQFGEERVQDLVTAVSEAGMNAIRHADGGRGSVASDAGGATVQVWIEDWGHGINFENIPQATLAKGYTTAGSFGHGFKIMLQTIDRIWLLTGTGGTTVVLEQDKTSPHPGWL